MEQHNGGQDASEVILDRAIAVSEGEFEARHPAVMSCGGIYLPRPRAINPADPLYHVLNTPAARRPAKVVSALLNKNVLDTVTGKESLN